MVVKCCFTLLAILLVVGSVQGSVVNEVDENGVKTTVFLSPKFELSPGSVCNKFYHDIDFPRGHIAVKSFEAEVIDEAGNSVPLYETYLHHWVVVNYYQLKGIQEPKYHNDIGFRKSDYIIAGNDGLCLSGLSQYFGLGSETRKTDTYIPDPYGLEFGNSAEIPTGYEEKWLLNVHAIDTRGVHDKLGCTECKRSLYNVTVDEYGRVLEPSYVGGMRCCHDNTQCRLREGFQGVKRGLYLKYTVKYVDWHSSIVPVRAYIFDVTDQWRKSGTNSRHDCLIEYSVEPCSKAGQNSGCVETRSVSITLPTGGHMIYGVAHQHSGGIGSALYGEDGRVLCSSSPIYGRGMEPGNEAGYIVGMSTCYPQPGSVEISNGENLTFVSNYSSAKEHTGVMGLFYILVADSDSSNSVVNASRDQSVGIHKKLLKPSMISAIALLGVAAVAVAIVTHQRRIQRGDLYEPMPM